MPSLPKIIFTILMCLVMIIWSAFGTWNVLRDRSYPIVEGFVVERQPVEWWRILDREMLIIQIKESDETVFARVNNFEEPLDPENVRFHYSGNPEKEVILDIEENPIPILIICFFSAIILSIYVWYSNRLSRNLDVIDVSPISDVMNLDL